MTEAKDDVRPLWLVLGFGIVVLLGGLNGFWAAYVLEFDTKVNNRIAYDPGVVIDLILFGAFFVVMGIVLLWVGFPRRAHGQRGASP